MIIRYLAELPFLTDLNRPLRQDEQKFYLNRDFPQLFGAFDYLSVIKANSTYLEIVDSYYHTRGILSLVGFICLALSICSLALFFSFLSLEATRGVVYDWQIFFLWLLLAGLFTSFGVLFLIAELSNPAYNPIRFNRKNRMVYRLRKDGTVLAHPWEKLFFHTGAWSSVIDSHKHYVLRAHLLGDDGVTVLETFSMGNKRHHAGIFEGSRLFEFIRRYMDEENNQSLAIYRCVPVDRRGQTVSWYYYLQIIKRFGVDQAIFFSIWDIPVAASRWLINHFSKKPSWPLEIEYVCVNSLEKPSWTRSADQDRPIKFGQFTEEYRNYDFKETEAIARAHEEAVTRLKAMHKRANDPDQIARINDLVKKCDEIYGETAA